MTSRGFGTEAAAQGRRRVKLTRVAPLEVGIDALERGIARRSRRVVRRRGSAPLLPVRMTAQPVVDRATQRGLAEALEIARAEDAPLTTPQPERSAVSAPRIAPGGRRDVGLVDLGVQPRRRQGRRHRARPTCSSPSAATAGCSAAGCASPAGSCRAAGCPGARPSS